MEYSYPFREDWSTEEVVEVIAFFEAIEAVYEKGIAKEDFMSKYRRFKEIVPGKSDEKQIGDEFEEVSGYSLYRALQKAKQAPDKTRIRL